MSTIKHVTISELQKRLHSSHVPSDTQLTVTIDENKKIKRTWNKEKALKAMKRLKGSGNGQLVSALLRERKKDKLYK